MAVVSNSDDGISNGNPKAGTIEIREGDWKAYQYYSKRCDDHTIVHHFGSAIEYQRACAMAYLGRRAQHHGGVCSTTHAHIMTPYFIASLAASNKAQRFSRYPWLEGLMNLLAEIERIQDEISFSSNVISLASASK